MARIMNGVVGRMGNTAPTIPSPTKIKPKNRNTILIRSAFTLTAYHFEVEEGSENRRVALVLILCSLPHGTR